MKTDVFVPGNVAQFKCLMCGKCCGDWHINLDQESHAFLKENLSEIDNTLKMEDVLSCYDANRATDKKYAFLKFKQDRCLFLRDNKCKIFERFGKNSGVFVCQNFPVYNFLTPRGEFYNISFFCTASSRSLLTTGQFELFKNPENFQKIKKSLEDFSRLKEVKFGLKQMITWDSYYLLEEFFLRVKRLQTIDLDQKILMLADFLNLLGVLQEKLINSEIFFSLQDFFWTKFEDNLKIIRQYKSDLEYQLNNIKFLVERSFSLYPNSSFKRVVEEVYGLFLSDVALGVKRYTVQYETYREQIKKYTYVLENYVFNKLSYNNLLITQGVSSGFKTIVFLYIFARLLFLARLTGEADEEQLVIQAVHIAERYFGHNLRVFDFWNRTIEKEPHVMLAEIAAIVQL